MTATKPTSIFRFTEEAVRSIELGLKIQFRHPVEPQPLHETTAYMHHYTDDGYVWTPMNANKEAIGRGIYCPSGDPGNRISVNGNADLVIEVEGTRIERIQCIDAEDSLEEAIDAYADWREAFAERWDDINGPGAWAANEWVWVVHFRRVANAEN
jgi:hypothetical protein